MFFLSSLGIIGQDINILQQPNFSADPTLLPVDTTAQPPAASVATRSRPKSRRRAATAVTATTLKVEDADASGASPLVPPFEMKIDERPASTASCLPVSNCLICGDKATGLVQGVTPSTKSFIKELAIL